MPRDVLSEVPLGENAYREHDALATVPHYWVPSSNQQEWYRIHCPDDAQIRDHGEVNSILVQAAQYRKTQRSFMARLLRKGPEANQMEMPLTRPDEYDLLKLQQKARLALLAWGNQTDIQLGAERLKQIISYPVEKTILENGMQLAWGAEQPASEEELLLIGQLSEMGDRLMDALRQHGLIVFERRCSAAKRIYVMIKDHHGQIDMAEDALQHPSYAQSFFQCQNTISSAMSAVLDICGNERINLFLEGVVSGKENLMINQLCTDQQTDLQSKYEQILPRVAHDTISSLHYFRRLHEYVNQEKIDEAHYLIDGLRGYFHFLAKTTNQGNIWDGRIYGMLSEFRKGIHLEWERHIRDLEMTNALNAVDFQQTHTDLVMEMERRVGRGKVGLIVLGGFHFCSTSTL